MEIDPKALYSVGEACEFIKSPKGGTISPITFRTWVRKGLLQAERRRVGSKSFVFVYGAELLRFLNPSPPPEWHGKTRKQLDRELRQMEFLARKHGINV